MLDKLKAVENRFEELCFKSEQPDFYNDPKKAAKLLRERLQLANVIGICLQEDRIVVDKSGDELVVVRVFLLAEDAVDKQSFHPSVTDPTGITGQIHTTWKSFRASQTGLKDRKLIFAQLRCLVDGDDVVFLTLITESVASACAITELYTTAVWQRYLLFGLAVREERAVFVEHWA